MTRRSTPAAYLLLARVSNLPTIWTNVLAAAALAGGLEHAACVAWIALTMSLIYSAGMWMNDACDAEFDRRARADRPIPRGEVSVSEVWTGVVVMAGFSAAVLWAADVHRDVWRWWLALSAAISYYNVRHKRDPFGPLAMGLCRGLVFGVTASAITGFVSTAVLVGGGVMTAYVLALTFIGKSLGPRAGRIMPKLIAGISLLDAVLIVASGAPLWLAAVGVAGFLTTLAAQRLVSGT